MAEATSNQGTGVGHAHGTTLGDLPLFAAADRAMLRAIEADLHRVHVDDGDVLMHQGEPATGFWVFLEGNADVLRRDERGERHVGSAHTGSVVGEVSLLRRTPRSATVVARGPVEALVGDATDFARLLEVPGVRERVRRAAAQKLAAHAQPTPVMLRDGTDVALRPLLPEDREELAKAVARMSAETLRQRFFSAGTPSATVLDYLVDLNYVDHFAWAVVCDDDHHPPGVGVARYIRDPHDRGRAEFAISVDPGLRGLGLGAVLMGALAAAATNAGIDRFLAYVLVDNAPMRALLDRAGAHWSLDEPGVVTTVVPVEAVLPFIPADLADRLGVVAANTVRAARSALF
jgi:CRP-like cAMP-binding protein